MARSGSRSSTRPASPRRATGSEAWRGSGEGGNVQMRRNLLRTSASNLYIYQNLPVLIPMKKPCSNPPIEPTVFSYKHVEDGHMRHCLVSNRALSFVRERFVAVATAGTLLILAAGCPGQSALAQGTTVIPPPPNPSHEPEFDPIDPHRAFDPKTGQNLVWDCNKKTWMDTKTGQGIGFNGRHDGNGDVIPPPSNPSHEPEFDPVDPNRAFDPKTGQNLIWDRDQHTWRDTKTGRGLGFSGRRVKEDCPPPRAGTTPPPPVSVLLESVQPRIGNNPWDPGNLLGGGSCGPADLADSDVHAWDADTHPDGDARLRAGDTHADSYAYADPASDGHATPHADADATPDGVRDELLDRELRVQRDVRDHGDRAQRDERERHDDSEPVRGEHERDVQLLGIDGDLAEHEPDHPRTPGPPEHADVDQYDRVHHLLPEQQRRHVHQHLLEVSRLEKEPRFK